MKKGKKRGVGGREIERGEERSNRECKSLPVHKLFSTIDKTFERFSICQVKSFRNEEYGRVRRKRRRKKR